MSGTIHSFVLGMYVLCPCTNAFGINYAAYFLNQVLNAGKDSSAKRKRRTPRVFRLLSRIVGSRTSNTYQPKVEALTQEFKH